MGLLVDGRSRTDRVAGEPKSPLDELNHLEAISTTAMIPYGPSGTGSDPFHNWDAFQMICRSVPGVVRKASETSVSSDLIEA